MVTLYLPYRRAAAARFESALSVLRHFHMIEPSFTVNITCEPCARVVVSLRFRREPPFDAIDGAHHALVTSLSSMGFTLCRVDVVTARDPAVRRARVWPRPGPRPKGGWVMFWACPHLTDSLLHAALAS